MTYSRRVREAVFSYAERVCRVFSQLGILSGTGLRIDRKFHATVRLYQCDPADERMRNFRQSDMIVGPWGQESGKPRRHSLSLESEIPVLDRWLSSKRKSLLLLSPFGSGKSVVLETFARRLAERIVATEKGRQSRRELVVPLPVRLRAWRWHEQEPFETFLFRSQTLLDGGGHDGTLQSDDFQALLEEGAILPLLDGFDELPGGYDCRDGASPREQALSELRRLVLRGGARYRVMVAARPGYGIENDSIFSREDRLSISEFNEAEIHAFIASRFGELEDGPTLAAAVRAFSRTEPDIREILSRPLFLATWCDRIADRPEAAPLSITDIMRTLFARAIDPVRIKHLIGLPTEQSKLFENEIVTQHYFFQRVPELGAVLAVFAWRRFGEAMWLDRVIKQTGTFVRGISDIEIQRLVFICVQAGFLTLTDNGEVYAIKVPLVEFLVGQFLASTVELDGGSSFVRTFRRWVWIPDLHDCLFFAIEAIRSGAPDTRWLAEECCEWLLSASTARSMGTTRALPHTDDILRPFIVLAARLGATPDSAANALVEHRFLADKFFGNVSVPILAGLRGPLVTPYVEALLRVAAKYSDECHLSRVCETLRIAGPRVIGEHVRDFIDAVVPYPSSDNQFEIRCEVAIEDAVARLPGKEVESAVATWFARLGSAGPNESRRLQGAISAAARFIERDAAAQGVELWLEKLETVSSEFVPTIFEIIEGFATRIPESDSERVLNLWWQRAVSASGPLQSGLARAVHAVASCLPLQASERILFARIERSIESIETADSALECALCEIARRIPEGTGLAVIRSLMQQMDGQRSEIKDTIAMAVSGAAERIASTDAPQTITLLQVAMAGPFADEAAKLADAIEETCQRLPEGDALDTANRILMWMTTVRGGLDSALARSVLAIARRVREQDVEVLTSKLIDYFGEFDETVQDALERAVFAAVARCPEMDVRPLVADWASRLSGLKCPSTFIILATIAAQKQTARLASEAADEWLNEMWKCDGLAVEAYAEAGRQAAGRIPPADAIIAVRRWRHLAEDVHDSDLKKYVWNAIWSVVARLPAIDAWQLIGEFRTNDEHASGLRVASFQPELAARLVPADAQGVQRFEYCWRTDPELLLDDRGECAPARIRRILASIASDTRPAPRTVSAESDNDTWEIGMEKQFSRGRALVIGISDYAAVNPLPSTVSKDAKDIADLLQAPERGGYAPERMTILLDRHATAHNIRNALVQLASNAEKEDTIIVYFSGHGGRKLTGRDAGTYLIPYDCDPNNLRDTSISGDEFTRLLSSITADRVVVLLDACHSAGAGELKSLKNNAELVVGLDEKAYSSLAEGVGRIFMASSRVSEYSLVLPGMNNSLFTHYLLEAMTAGVTSHSDGLIRVFDVFHYVSDKVSAHARERGQNQHPVFKAHDVENNFPIALGQGGKSDSRSRISIASRPKSLIGAKKVLLIRRLVDRWPELATYFEIPSADQARFAKGDEPRLILIWLEQRSRLSALRDAFSFLGWDDLIAEILDSP